MKCSGERTFFFESILEPEIRDFLGGGMDLLVVISVEFVVKNPLGLFDFADIFSDTGSDEVVLEPAIRSFNLTSGLGREGVNDLYIAVLENLFPLRSCEKIPQEKLEQGSRCGIVLTCKFEAGG